MQVSLVLSFLVLCLYKLTSASETWSPVKDTICFEAKGKKPGRFELPDSGFVQGIRLKYKSGGVNCYNRRKDHVSKFGCYSHHRMLKSQVGVAITDSDKQIMFPIEMMKSRWSTFVFSGGNTANGTTLTYYNDYQPTFLDKGSKLEVWYGEDLRNRNTHDNSGKTCAEVSVLFAKF